MISGSYQIAYLALQVLEPEHTAHASEIPPVNSMIEELRYLQYVLVQKW